LGSVWDVDRTAMTLDDVMDHRTLWMQVEKRVGQQAMTVNKNSSAGKKS